MKINLLLLGERRISWGVLKNLSNFSNSISLKALVTNCDFWKQAQIKLGINCIYINNDSRRTEEILAVIGKEKIDVLLSVQHNWVLPNSILEAVNGMAFNLHNAKLPNYKGYNSISHAIINGDIVYESTLHWMAERVDSGDIVHIGKTPIDKEDTALSLYQKSFQVAIDTVLVLLKMLANKEEIPRTPMSRKGSHFFAKDSLVSLCDLTNEKNKDIFERKVRGLFFPPCNTSYITTSSGQKICLIPSKFMDSHFFENIPANIIYE